MKSNSKIIGLTVTFLSWISVLAGVVLFIIMNDEWLLKKYETIVDIYQITILISITIFLPLSAVHSIRHLIGTGFSLARGIMFTCCFFISTLILYMNWGTTGVGAGLILGGIGVLPLSFISSIITKHWILLANDFFCMLGAIGCLIAEGIFTDDTDTTNENIIPLNVLRCSYAIWAVIPIIIPSLIWGDNNSSDWLKYIVSISLTILLGYLVRRGYKIVFIIFSVIYFIRFEIYSSQNYNLFTGDLVSLIINLANYVHMIIAIYATAMLFSPSSLKYFWGKKEPTISV